MTVPDLINGALEACGAMTAASNIYRFSQDREVRGINWWTVGFFALWGYWNCYYYPHLDQWFSFFAGAVLAILNTVWVIHVLLFARKR